ncbi:MAG: hypothetical protein IJ156_05020 [Bacteroidales bacterium]|nr:hypothetical protein [Bacteroidales bacterium]
MKKHLSFLSALLLFLSSFSAQAQELESGYFLGGNPYAFRLNPAFQSERNIFSIALGQTGLGAWSNLGVSSLLYPNANGYMYTFMNDRVSASEFLRHVRSRNNLDLDARINLLTVGFWAGKRYYTLDFNLRSLNALSIPEDAFRFLKEDAGSKAASYDMAGLGFRSKEFLEAAFGWSKNYDNVFNVGFRVKALLGIADADVMAKKLSLSMSGERWEIQAQSELGISSAAGVKYGLDEDGYLDFSSIEMGDIDDWHQVRPAGYGAAVDLGASWNVLPELTLSASVLDLGGLLWNRGVRGLSPETGYVWEPSGDRGDGDESWEDEIGDAEKALAGVFRFRDSGAKSVFDFLPFRVNLGAEYRMPFYDRLSVGALYQGRGGKCFGRHTGRLSLNWNPLSFLSMSASSALSDLGQSMGFVLNLHPGVLNLTLGADYIPFHCVSVSSLLDEDFPDQYRRFAVLPRDNMKLNFYIGLNLAFGRSRLDHAKRFVL